MINNLGRESNLVTINLVFADHSQRTRTNKNMSGVWKVFPSVKVFRILVPAPGTFSPARMITGFRHVGGPSKAASQQRYYEFQIKLLNELLTLRFLNAKYMKRFRTEKTLSDLMP